MNIFFSALGVAFVLGLMREAVQLYRLPHRRLHEEQKRIWRARCCKEQARRRGEMR